MKLSEAIRLGAMLSHQSYSAMDDGGGTCALVAALHAISSSALPNEFSAVREVWPWCRKDRQFCPACNHQIKIDTALICAHLNDSHRWTRERIADWVATVEPQQPDAAAPAEVSTTDQRVAEAGR